MFMVRIRFSYSFGNAVALILLSANLGWIQGQFNFTENSLRYRIFSGEFFIRFGAVQEGEGDVL